MLFFLGLILGDIIFSDNFQGQVKWDADINILNCTDNATRAYNLSCPEAPQTTLYIRSYPYASHLTTYTSIILPTYSANLSTQILYQAVNPEGQNINIRLVIDGVLSSAFPIYDMGGWTYAQLIALVPRNGTNITSIGIHFSYDEGNTYGYVQVVSITVSVISYYPQPLPPTLSETDIILLAVGVAAVVIIIAVGIVFLIRNRCRVFGLCRCKRTDGFDLVE